MGSRSSARHSTHSAKKPSSNPQHSKRSSGSTSRSHRSSSRPSHRSSSHSSSRRKSKRGKQSRRSSAPRTPVVTGDPTARSIGTASYQQRPMSVASHTARRQIDNSNTLTTALPTPTAGTSTALPAPTAVASPSSPASPNRPSSRRSTQSAEVATAPAPDGAPTASPVASRTSRPSAGSGYVGPRANMRKVDAQHWDSLQERLAAEKQVLVDAKRRIRTAEKPEKRLVSVRRELRVARDAANSIPHVAGLPNKIRLHTGGIAGAAMDVPQFLSAPELTRLPTSRPRTSSASLSTGRGSMSNLSSARVRVQTPLRTVHSHSSLPSSSSSSRRPATQQRSVRP